MLDCYLFSKETRSFELTKVACTSFFPGKECSICHYFMSPGGRKVVKTSCPIPHVFHVDCLKGRVKEGLRKSATVHCPTCTTGITDFAKALVETDEKMLDLQRLSKFKKSFEQGMISLQKAKDNNLDCSFIDTAIEQLEFVCKNDYPGADFFFAQAKKLKGEYFLHKAREQPSNMIFHDQAIYYLYLAHRHGCQDAETLLTEARERRQLLSPKEE